MRELSIDPEFADLFPDADAIADEKLEARLLADGGPTDTIKVWKGKNVILDGHRRYKICRAHGLPFRVEEIPLADRKAVLRWMIEFQICRRNLGTKAGKDAINKLNRLNLRALYEDGIEHGAKGIAEQQTAAQTGVAQRTVQRHAALAKAMETILPEIVSAAKHGDLDLSQRDALILAGRGEDEQRRLWEEFQAGDDTFHQVLCGEPEPTRPKPVSDTVSESEAPAKPDKRELFHEARKRLSYFIAALDKIAHVYPGPCYPLSVKAAKDIGPILNTWERDEW